MPKYNELTKEGSRQVSERFMIIYRHMHMHRVVKNMTDFATYVGTHPNVISGIDKGDRFVTIDMIWELVKKYPVNLNFLFKGEGSILGESDIIKQVEFLRDKMKEVEMLLEKIDSRVSDLEANQ